MFDYLERYPLLNVTSAFAGQATFPTQIAHTSTPGLFVSYTIPRHTGIIVSAKTEIILFH